MDSYEMRVVLFGLIAAVLLIPIGGPGQLWVIALIAAICAFDIYRHRRKA